jgi:hypothetical protein
MRLSTCGFVLTLALCASATAADVWYSAEFGLASKYMWRGAALVDGPVFQPGVAVGVGGFSLGIWGNQDLNDVNETPGEFSEVDYVLDYTYESEKFDLSAGATLYTFPGDPSADQTNEIYFTFAGKVAGLPTLGFWHDNDNVKGTYLTFGGGYAVEREGKPDIVLSLTAGYGDDATNKALHNVDASGLADLELKVALANTLVENEADGFSFAYEVSLAGTWLLGEFVEGPYPASNVVLGFAWTTTF